MRKFLYLSLVAILLGFFATSCKKDVPTTPQPVQQGNVEFTINQADFGGLKDATDSVPECSDFTWSYAKFTLSGIEYKTNLIEMASGQMNTEAIQLDTGMYVLNSFYVWYDNGTEADESDDILVRAAPMPGSKYYNEVINQLELNVHVQGFLKTEYVIDVLCYEELYYEYFGFIWFNINDIIVHQICVFGDVCTSDPDLYAGSLYEQQSNGLQMDMPAITEVNIWKDGVLINTFSNEAWLGEGECLPVHWADDVDLDEEFYLVIKTLLPVGEGFDYVTTDSIAIDPDDGSGLTLDDGVLVYEVGNCHDGPGIYGCNAWINLPPETFDFTITDLGTVYNAPYPSASLGGYFDYLFAGISNGYAVHDGEWPGWCADKEHTVGINQLYQAKFVSSVQPFPAGFHINHTQANELNWIFNNLDNYFTGIDLDNLTDYNATWDADDWRQVQWAIWSITENIDLSGAVGLEVAYQIATDAQANPLFQPQTGDVGIVFVLIDNEVQLQLCILSC